MVVRVCYIIYYREILLTLTTCTKQLCILFVYVLYQGDIVQTILPFSKFILTPDCTHGCFETGLYVNDKSKNFGDANNNTIFRIQEGGEFGKEGVK